MATRVVVPDEVRAVLARWYSGDVLDGTTVLRGSFFGRLFGSFGQHAVTLNGTVHLTPQALDVASATGTVLLGHELFHVEHQRRIGWWRFLVSYAVRWRPVHLRQGWKHPYEVPAYARGREVRAALGG